MRCSVVCPATSANLGPGFDAIGLALDLYNIFDVEPGSSFELSGEGFGAEAATKGGAENLFVKAYGAARDTLDLPPVTGLHVGMRLQVPPGRGLGSSATAIVGGVLAAEALSGQSLDPASRLELVTSLEGHPDNVVPCLQGGLCLSVDGENGLTSLRLPLPDPPAFVVSIPTELYLSTKAMRAVLPKQVPFGDAVHNSSRAALLIAALTGGRNDVLPVALDDRLHEPFRGPRIPGFKEVRQATLDVGGYGTVISGSGPSLLSLCPPAVADLLIDVIRETWSSAGVKAEVLRAHPAGEGARVTT